MSPAPRTGACRGRRRAGALTALAATVLSTLAVAAPASAGTPLGYDPSRDKGSLFHIAQAVGAASIHREGFTGKGVGVALVDTGVTEVRGLDTGNVVHGPDLSFDSQDPELAHRDAYGHGTHLGSIIAGRDATGSPQSFVGADDFKGIAPDATLLSVKVGASDGAVDVSQVIAGINWVVAHRNDNGLNIRVINLSYGTDSVQPADVDPLTYAVENAWKHGIVVVVAGGNDGSDVRTLANPATSPHVLTVGVDDTQGTLSVKDDAVPAWATRGNNQRHVDVVAPGVSVVGLRVPNGYADERNPQARVGARFARASGTSQAAAVVSGEVALLLQKRPAMTPDQVKQAFMNTAQRFPNTATVYRGSGLTAVDRAAGRAPQGIAMQSAPYSTGLGSLEAARGSSHVFDGVAELRGETDVFGAAWDPTDYASAVARGDIWQGPAWRGTTLTGDGWEGRMWRGGAWTGRTWSGRMWRDAAWSGRMWRDGSWTGSAWTADGWTGRMWRDAQWTGRTWRTADSASQTWG